MQQHKAKQSKAKQSMKMNEKYCFNEKHIYVTWVKFKIDSKEEFHQKLVMMLSAEVHMFNRHKKHQNKILHYHVMFFFVEKVHWSDTVKRFLIEKNTNVIQFEKLKLRQCVDSFLKNTMMYCVKDSDTFEERLSLEGAVAEQKKWKWQNIIDEENKKKAYMVNYSALKKAILRMKSSKVVSTEREWLTEKFWVLKIMSWWMNKYVVKCNWTEHPKSLIIIDDFMTGKSARAELQSNSIVMNSDWCMKSIFSDTTHIVVSDVRSATFEYADKLHQRNVLREQKQFNCCNFQQKMCTVEWGLLCIWICNFDNDPHKDRAVADYIKETAHIFQIRDRVSECSWGKLYKLIHTEREEEDKNLLKTLTEVNQYMNTEYVNENSESVRWGLQNTDCALVDDLYSDNVYYAVFLSVAACQLFVYYSEKKSLFTFWHWNGESPHFSLKSFFKFFRLQWLSVFNFWLSFVCNSDKLMHLWWFIEVLNFLDAVIIIFLVVTFSLCSEVCHDTDLSEITVCHTDLKCVVLSDVDFDIWVSLFSQEVKYIFTRLKSATWMSMSSAKQHLTEIIFTVLYHLQKHLQYLKSIYHSSTRTQICLKDAISVHF